ncbi:MAG: Na+/H+ antiporter NhaC [Flavobacteriales bacterium]|nr:Na+/H+ antiporter NhaC [Flavobacteriales bacterium]
MSAATPRPASLWLALLPLLLLVALLVANVAVFGDGGLGGPNQLALLFAAAVALGVGVFQGHRFKGLLEHVVRGISLALGAVLILLLIGALAGTWLIAGIIPAMIHHGMLLLSPAWFLVAACLVCAVVSLATGSSWSTAATVGIALLGIGKALGFHEGLVAGAVISGAYFGDKLSPLSDTTNLAPAVAGTDLFTHILYLLWTTVPSMGIALLLFGGIGLFGDTAHEVPDTASFHAAILEKFNVGWWLYLVPVAMVVMIARRVPVLPALFAGTLLGALFAVLFQPQLIQELGSDGGPLRRAYEVAITAMGPGLAVETGHAAVDELLVAKGMAGMLNTVWLIICALAFGGAMEGAGLLQRITGAVMGLVRGDGSLIATTTASCVFVNVTASDQYLSIVVPGRMFAPVFAQRGLAPQVLSRTLEDGGTVTSPLVPWNTCGAYMGGVLGVATLTYLPFCFFNLASPLMTMLFGAMGWRIARIGQNRSGSGMP